MLGTFPRISSTYLPPVYGNDHLKHAYKRSEECLPALSCGRDPSTGTIDPALEVIRFDVPGIGGSPAPPIPYRFSLHAWLVTKRHARLPLSAPGRGGLDEPALAPPDSTAYADPAWR
jgi:hypothetical protein